MQELYRKTFKNSILLGILLSIFLLPLLAFGTDKLIVENASDTTTFAVSENGTVYTSGDILASMAYPGFWLNETGTGNKGLYFVLDNKTFQMQRRPQGFGATNEASVFRMRIEAPNNSIAIDADGDVGFGVPIESISYPIQMAGGARCTGTEWINYSSREGKDNIKELDTEEAIVAFEKLTPVTFTYKSEKNGQHHVGFIAEDVPDLVAVPDRKGLSMMDIVAVLTKVVQEQQKTIAELSDEVNELKSELRLKGSLVSVELPLR